MGMGLSFGRRESANPTVGIWQLPSGKKLTDLHGHKGRIRRVVFSPDGRFLLSVAEDRTARRWDLDQAKEEDETTIAGLVRCAAFTPDVKSLVTAGYSKSDGDTNSTRIAVRDLATGEESLRIDVPDKMPWHLAVSPNGRILAAYLRASVGSKDPFDDRIILWDAATGAELLSFKLDDGHVRALAFSPDGKTLVSGMDRGTALFWSLTRAYDKLDNPERSEGEQ